MRSEKWCLRGMSRAVVVGEWNSVAIAFKGTLLVKCVILLILGNFGQFWRLYCHFSTGE